MEGDRSMQLFEPLDINGMKLPNRILVPAMVTRLSGEDGFVNDDIIERYRRYAEGGVGMIVVEATSVHGAKSGPLLRLSDDEFVPGHRDLAARVHATSDSKVVPQIIHFMKVARSGWRQKIESLDESDIESIIRDFGEAAARCREAGYDGVELHSAHAYTLSSFLSRHNHRRDDYAGKTLEGRLRMFGRVMTEVRHKVGHDFPVGVRFLAEEAVKDGYGLPDSQLIALRMAQLGVDYISLSVGGKFEDAVHREGQPLYPYTGYSGDRCMPGTNYPSLPHAHLAAGIKQFINERGFDIPVVSAGKISQPEEAEALLADGKADLIGMARQLLADPDWPHKVASGRADDIVHCVYCNVCKQLDENFKKVTCFLWPKNLLQAPADEPEKARPEWDEKHGDLRAVYDNGRVKLSYTAAIGSDIACYDIYRAMDDGEMQCIEAVKGRRFIDNLVLGGVTYQYYIRACDAHGRASLPSNLVTITIPQPDFVTDATKEVASHA